MISTHVLDTSLGNPAEGITVQLEKKSGDGWQKIGAEKTNTDGRISFQCPAESGVYRLQFQIDEYFKKNNQPAFFVDASVMFRIENAQRKYHVPLLLNPYGYSTYRGS